MSKYEELVGLAPEQYFSRVSKLQYIRDLNTILFYDIIFLKWIPDTSVFVDLLFNYNTVLHGIVSLLLQRIDVPKEPIMFTLITP